MIWRVGERVTYGDAMHPKENALFQSKEENALTNFHFLYLSVALIVYLSICMSILLLVMAGNL